MKAKRESDGRQHDHQVLEVMRQQAVKAVREGVSPADVATTFGVNRVTVYRWIAAFNQGGQKALLAKPVPGRPSSLSESELAWLYRNIADHTPQQFRFEFGLWTIGLIRRLNRTGDRGGFLVKVKQVPQSALQVADSIALRPQRAECRRWIRAGVGG